MIEWLKTWSNQIIVATIISIILEMLLPEGNNKKYIKMVIGIYVLFIIINPVITKITGNSLAIEDFDYNKYFDDSVSISLASEEFEETNSKLITQAYIESIENDIKSKIEQKGYKVSSCKINIIGDENPDKYGTLTNISIQLSTIIKENENIDASNNIQIENIEVNVNNSKEEKEQEKIKIKDKDIEVLKEYLSNEYSLAKEFININ